MNNCFLLISTDAHLEKDCDSIEIILRALMRKFRKTADFYRISSKLLKASDENSQRGVLQKIENCDAIIIIDGKNACKIDFLPIYYHEHYTAGKCIIAPVLSEQHSISSELSAKLILSQDNVNAAIKAATERSYIRKSPITVCSEPCMDIGKFMLSCIEILGNIGDVEIECLSVNEFIWQYMKGASFSDVILTDEHSAGIISTLFSLPRMYRDGYVRYTGKDLNIYAREILPYDEMTNCAFSGMLLSCSGAIENEMKLSNVSAWLRRAVAIASENCLKASREEYVQQILHAINDRIRRNGAKNGI